MRKLILVLLMLLFLTGTASASDYFREGRAIAWTLYGDSSGGDVTRDFALEFQYEISGVALMPPPFSDLGWSPTAIVGSLTYASNPQGETGDVIWSRVTAYYDNLFGSEYLEGRAIYEDQAQGSYLGSGLGIRPIGNIWIGAYYLTGGNWMFAGEGAYRINETFLGYGQLRYYDDLESWEGKVGVEIAEAAYLEIENSKAEYIFKLGAVYKL